MTVLVDKKTKVVVQGITGYQGQYHTKAMKEFGTKIVGGVTPGKGGSIVEDVPVFDSVEDAVAETGANTSVIFVPAPYAKDAIIEAIDSEIKTIVVITEHIPFHDMIDVMAYTKGKEVHIIGPNCPGLCAPTLKCKIGIMPGRIFLPGRTGVISRSGTLTYEIVYALTVNKIGQSTCIGLGGDPVTGTNFVEALQLFEKDKETDRIVLVGEIGGTAEEDAAKYIKKMKKKVYAYIAGQSAPPGKRMGHAGAIITRGAGTAESKIKALTEVGVKVAKMPADIARIILESEEGVEVMKP